MTAPAGIVWLASFPKSGNTWFRILLGNLAAKDAGPADINNLEERGGIASSRHEFEAATMLDSGLLSHDDIDALRPRVYALLARDVETTRWIKVHDAYTHTPDGEPLLGQNVARAAVYLVRDPRDVAVSLSHHNSTSIDNAIALMNRRDGTFCGGRNGLAPQLRQKLAGWSGHVASWRGQTDVPLHLLRYEDLRAATADCFAQALTFAEQVAPMADVERAVRHADFDELRRQETEKGFGERMSRTAPFFRAGRVGGWRDVLSREQVAAIEQCHGSMMAELGYEVSV